MPRVRCASCKADNDVLARFTVRIISLSHPGLHNMAPTLLVATTMRVQVRPHNLPSLQCG
jgi:hypothetical protein